MTTKTSTTDPIRVDWIICGASGAFGITFAPGKRASGIGGRWERDLDADLRELRRQRATVIAPLIPEAEMAFLGVPDLLTQIVSHGLKVAHYPFPDGGVPRNVAAFAAFVETLVQLMSTGENVVAHCRGGLGRAGLLAACVLLRLGRFRNAAAAIAEVRRVRGALAVETQRQEHFVVQYARAHHARTDDVSGMGDEMD